MRTEKWLPTRRGILWWEFYGHWAVESFVCPSYICLCMSLSSRILRMFLRLQSFVCILCISRILRTYLIYQSNPLYVSSPAIDIRRHTSSYVYCRRRSIGLWRRNFRTFANAQVSIKGIYVYMLKCYSYMQRVEHDPYHKGDVGHCWYAADHHSRDEGGRQQRRVANPSAFVFGTHTSPRVPPVESQQRVSTSPVFVGF